MKQPHKQSQCRRVQLESSGVNRQSEPQNLLLEDVSSETAQSLAYDLMSKAHFCYFPQQQRKPTEGVWYEVEEGIAQQPTRGKTEQHLQQVLVLVAVGLDWDQKQDEERSSADQQSGSDSLQTMTERSLQMGGFPAGRSCRKRQTKGTPAESQGGKTHVSALFVHSNSVLMMSVPVVVSMVVGVPVVMSMVVGVPVIVSVMLVLMSGKVGLSAPLAGPVEHLHWGSMVILVSVGVAMVMVAVVMVAVPMVAMAEHDVHDGVTKEEILPKNNGTFQMSADLDVSSVPAEDWTKYECVFQLSKTADLPTRLEKGIIRTNADSKHRN
ncbi:unnamed protein product [Menidia menidia]|uniref:(Atlantic silverside) hypothetical protein n=1 Tax=Menidia menidia TaxID=238744 RepID=A0A8S4AKT3_9TELE|nr:unnamed protein product [Menidia menidia]